MRIVFLLLFMICATCQIEAQNSQVKVTLKSGVVLKGELKELNPTEYVVVKVAGIESKISMEDVGSIETLNSSSSNNGTKESAEQFDTKQFGKYDITDHAQYPESYEFNIEGQKIKMLLVRGGTFNMGYDGDGSLGMKSEPVHQVNLSSYYISSQYIKEETALKLLGKNKKSYKDKYYRERWKGAQEIADKIAENTHKPYRLLTEAEWEYATLMPNANIIWEEEENIEWCSDFFEEYNPSIQTNPQGPTTGRKHVYRSYYRSAKKWNRKPYNYSNPPEALIRIAISAEAINM